MKYYVITCHFEIKQKKDVGRTYDERSYDKLEDLITSI